jgi:hypothetical protein
MFEITQPEKKLYPDHNLYSLFVNGDASIGERFAIITIPINDKEGNFVESKTIRISGKDFNEFWLNFTTDKKIIESLFPDADISSIPDNVVNPL